MMQFQVQRKKMIQRLNEQGITDVRLLQAMYRIPRHRFVANGFEFQAYDEKALPIGFGQTISHPYTVARMTELLKLSNGDKVLEIGTGSGYQTALLCELGNRVFTVEIKQELVQQSKKVLNELKYTFAIACKDGSTGWRAHAPYDAIIVTAGAPLTPEILLDQLTDCGRLLIPLGSKNQQQLWLYEKRENTFAIDKFDHLVFVPLVGKEGWQKNG
jgi:protein-L-isoaspartate(D-aspartate) O-methyltransferase